MGLCLREQEEFLFYIKLYNMVYSLDFNLGWFILLWTVDTANSWGFLFLLLVVLI